MPHVIIVALVGIAAGAAYAIWKKGGPSAIDAASAHATSPETPVVTVPVTVPGPTGPMTVPVTVPAPPPPGPPPPPAAPKPSAAPNVTTIATATEGPLSLRIVNPAIQPKVPSVEKEALARSLAPDLSALLVNNRNGASYFTKDKTIVDRVKAFQAAVNLAADGYYGPQTSGALMYFLGSGPPPPYFYGTGERVIKLYAPL